MAAAKPPLSERRSAAAGKATKAKKRLFEALIQGRGSA